MPSFDASKIRSLPKVLQLVFAVNVKAPKDLAFKRLVQVNDPSSNWNAETPLLRADLILLGNTDLDLSLLAHKAHEFSHEAGCVWLEKSSPKLEQALLSHGFEKCAPRLFQKKSGSTPEEYGQEYIDRWGDNDWLANAKLAATQILEHIPSHMNKKTMKVIDVGCLNGYIMESLRREGVQNLFGTDISYFLAVERNLNPEFLTGITVGDFSQNNYPAAVFDVVICMEVLEHIPPKLTHKFISELARITKPDGILLISTSEDWHADDTHINCRNRAQWYFEFSRCGLVPEGSQVIFPGFNSFVVRPANNILENWRHKVEKSLKLLAAGRLKRPEDR